MSNLYIINGLYPTMADTPLSLHDIDILVKQGESNNLEFKTSTANLHSVCETLCAFLNGGKGGTVLIGVKNNGKIVGQDVSDNTRLEIANLFSKLEPPTSVAVDYAVIEKNKCVIKMTVISNPSLAPYVFDGKPYWRVESQTKPMPQQRYHQLLIERTHKIDGWELAKAKYFTIEDLDKNQIINAVNQSIKKGRLERRFATDDPKEALLRLKVLVGGNITNAAVVLFCQDPMPYYPQCLLRMAKFKGTDKSDMLDSRRAHGNAFFLLEEAEQFLKHNMSIKSEFIPGKMARKDIPEYPLRAIREAMVNAICHRDYGIKGGSTSLLIFSDRLEITSHGTLPFGITVDDLKKTHESLPRNERITHVMNKTGEIESVGTGTEEMIKECKNLGLPEPEYIERGNTFVVCFKKETLSLKDNLVIRHNKIISFLQLYPGLSSTEIQKRIDIDIATRTLRRDLKILNEQGRVRLEGKGTSAIWFINNKGKD